jgi:hypothetical protein
VGSPALNWKKQKQDQGLCTVCGVRPLVTKWHCRQCADAYNQYKRNRREAGFCKNCGQKRPLKTKWLCEVCYPEARLQAVAIRYNLPLATYKEMLRRVCDICGTKHNLHIDHDHLCCTTQSRSCGKCVRGILCGRHNTLVGTLEHVDIALAKKYLRKVKRD